MQEKNGPDEKPVSEGAGDRPEREMDSGAEMKTEEKTEMKTEVKEAEASVKEVGEEGPYKAEEAGREPGAGTYRTEGVKENTSGTEEATKTEYSKTEDTTAEDTSRAKGPEEEPPIYTLKHRLTKSKTDRLLAGVCGGLGEYFGIDSTLVRLAFVAFTLLGGGSGLLIYIILTLIMPSEDAAEMTARETFDSNVREMKKDIKVTGAGIKERSDRGRLLGAILLVIGFILLLDRFRIFQMFWWMGEFFWPLIFILAGFWLLLRNRA